MLVGAKEKLSSKPAYFLRAVYIGNKNLITVMTPALLHISIFTASFKSLKARYAAGVTLQNVWPEGYRNLFLSGIHMSYGLNLGWRDL